MSFSSSLACYLCSHVKLFVSNPLGCFAFWTLIWWVFHWKAAWIRNHRAYERIQEITIVCKALVNLVMSSIWFLTPSLRLALLNEAKEVRAAGLRSLRYLIRDTTVLQKVLRLQVDYLIARWDPALTTPVRWKSAVWLTFCGSKNIA